MLKKLNKIMVGFCALSVLFGCASIESAGVPLNEHQLGNEAGVEDKTRKRNTLLTIGGILLLGAIVAHEGQDGARDALRDAERP